MIRLYQVFIIQLRLSVVIAALAKEYAFQSAFSYNFVKKFRLRSAAAGEGSRSPSFSGNDMPLIIRTYCHSRKSMNEERRLLYCFGKDTSTDGTGSSDRREFIKSSVLLGTAILSPGVSLALESSDVSKLNEGTKISPNNTTPKDIDPFASFGESLNQIDFGNLNGSVQKISDQKKTIEMIDTGDKSLGEMIEEKKKQRGVDPRTHG